MSRPTIFQRYTDNAIVGASVGVSPAVMDTYDEDVLLQHRPSSRVRWDLPSPNTVQLTFTVSSQRVDLLVLPVCNADTSGTLTSGSGMNVSIPAPTMRPSGMSATLAVDLTLLEPNAAKRTSSSFVLTFSGASAGLILGGFIGLYGPMRSFIDRDFRWGFTKQPIGYQVDQENQAGVDYVSSYDTQAAVYTLTTLASEDDRAEIEDWLDANFVSGYPCFIWVDPDGRNIPLVCRVIGQPEIVDLINDAIQISITVKELSKGEPVA